MTLSRIGRLAMASLVSAAMGLGITSCGGGNIGFMWVLGTQYNQIGGFRIADYTGNLIGIPGSPLPSGGTNPVMLTIKSGGRYLYVLNAGDATGTTGNFSLFSVGSNGVLAYQQSFHSKGTFPVWITTDSTGSNLFVLDRQAPGYDGKKDLNGSITVFPLDPNTGRPVEASAASFEVGQSPAQMRNSAGCIYTLDSKDQTIFPYAVDAASGKLTNSGGLTIPLNTVQATSVNIGGSYVYVTDAGSPAGGAGSILAFSQGTSCGLTPVGAPVANLATASFPVQTINSIDDKYLYVLNHSTQNTNYSNSTVSAFAVQGDGSLQPITSDQNNPYSVGSGPVCMAVDPTNRYLYTSDQIASTVTGKRIVDQYGYLTNLSKGSSFPTVGTPSCLVISQDKGQ